MLSPSYWLKFENESTYCSDTGIKWEVVFYNEVFELLSDATVDEAASDLEKATARIKEIQSSPDNEQDKEELRALASIRTTARLATGVKKQFDSVFEALFDD